MDNESNKADHRLLKKTKGTHHTLNFSKATVRLPPLTIFKRSDSWQKGGNRPTRKILKTIDYWQEIIIPLSDGENDGSNNNNNNDSNEMTETQLWQRKIAFYKHCEFTFTS